MSSFDRLKLRMSMSGGSMRQSKINDSIRLHDNSLKDDPSYNTSIYFWIPGVSPYIGEQIFFNFYNRKYSSANGNIQEFITSISNIVEVGDYFYNSDDDTYWICTKSFNIDNINRNGELTQCNWKLRWQQSDGTILEYPCLDLNSTQYNSGETEDRSITLGSAQHMETVQATSDTISLASPQRFFISRNNKIPFIVTQNDTTASNYGKGLCKITVIQDQLMSDDNQDLGICNYKSPVTTTIPPSPSKIEGNNQIKIGCSETYIAKFYDGDNNEITQTFTWNINSEFNDKIAQTFDTNKIILLINDGNYIGSNFILQIIMGSSIVSEINIKVVNNY